MLKTYAHEQAGTIKCCNGITKVYVFEIDNMKIAAYLSHIGSSMAGSDVIDANWLTGASRFIMFGLAGSLDSDKTNGKLQERGNELSLCKTVKLYINQKLSDCEIHI